MNLKGFFGDAHSIESYHQAMKRLEKLHPEDKPTETRAGPSGHVRLVARLPGSEEPRRGNTPRAKTGGSSGNIRRIRGHSARIVNPADVPAPRLLFIDDSLLPGPILDAGAAPGLDPDPVSQSAPPPPPPPPPVVIDDKDGDIPALQPTARSAELAVVSRTERRQAAGSKSRLTLVAVSLAVTALVGGGTALILLRSNHATSHHRPAASAPRVATAGVGPPPVTSTAASPVATGAAPPPPQPVVTPSEVGPNSGSYYVTGGPINVTLSATAPCWIDLRIAPDGSEVFTGLVGPGWQQSFPAAASLWMRVGFPAGLKVVVDGQAVPLPASSSPYNLSFVETPSPGR